MNGKSLNNQLKLAYIHGYVAAKIEGFAQGGELSAAEIADGLGALLVGEEVRQVLGVPDRVSDVSRSTTEGANVQRSKVAVDVRARTEKPRASGAHGKGVKTNSYWQSKTPAQRTAENKRRALKRKDRVVKVKSKKKGGYWSGLNKEQRHVEMVKRQKVRKEKAARKLAAQQSEQLAS